MSYHNLFTAIQELMSFYMLLAGAGIGFLSGLMGIGGGTLLVPLFRLVFGFSALAATATSLCAVVPIALAGSIQHLRQGSARISVAFCAGLAGALVSPVSAHLAALSPSWLVMLVAACVIAYGALSMLPYKPWRRVFPPLCPRTFFTGQQDRGRGVRIHLCIKACLIGAIAGVFAGFIGVGGGFIMVPLFVKFLDFDMSTASGTSLITIPLIALPAIVMQYDLGFAQIDAALALALSAIPCSILGARLSKRLPDVSLRICFALLLLAVACILAFVEFLAC